MSVGSVLHVLILLCGLALAVLGLVSALRANGRRRYGLFVLAAIGLGMAVVEAINISAG